MRRVFCLSVIYNVHHFDDQAFPGRCLPSFCVGTFPLQSTSLSLSLSRCLSSLFVPRSIKGKCLSCISRGAPFRPLLTAPSSWMFSSLSASVIYVQLNIVCLLVCLSFCLKVWHPVCLAPLMRMVCLYAFIFLQ